MQSTTRRRRYSSRCQTYREAGNRLTTGPPSQNMVPKLCAERMHELDQAANQDSTLEMLPKLLLGGLGFRT